jgi:hypothetical protein
VEAPATGLNGDIPFSGVDTLPAVRRAEAEAERVRQLVEAGAMPRVALVKAEAALTEAKDLAVLDSTLYGRIAVEDLTEEQADAMVAAAQRNWTRQQEKFDHARKLVDAGVTPRTSLEPLELEVQQSAEVHAMALDRSRLVRELLALAQTEQEIARQLEEAPEGPLPMVDRFDGDGVFQEAHFRAAAKAFQSEFGKELPVSARGDTALHRALGFDHRGRVDVAISPDTKEGKWLRDYLEALRVPFYAIRGFVPGKATAAHFHLGPPSLRIRKTD